MKLVSSLTVNTAKDAVVTMRLAEDRSLSKTGRLLLRKMLRNMSANIAGFVLLVMSQTWDEAGQRGRCTSLSARRRELRSLIYARVCMTTEWFVS
jgi:hypothetical protein